MFIVVKSDIMNHQTTFMSSHLTKESALSNVLTIVDKLDKNNYSSKIRNASCIDSYRMSSWVSAKFLAFTYHILEVNQPNQSNQPMQKNIEELYLDSDSDD